MTKPLETPKISVIIPIYNTAKYLPACLDSIINQTYKNLEIILIDDGSTDDSSKIINDYAKKDKRIKTVHQENAGQSAARNKGLDLTTGDYIYFTDSDDEIDLTFLEKHIKSFKKDTSLTVCGIHYKRLNQDSVNDVYINPLRSRKPKEDKKAYLLYLLAVDGRMYSSTNKLFDAKIAKTLRFDTSLNFAEDTKFVYDYLAQKSGEPSFILEPLYIYNFGTETSTIKHSATKWSNWQTAYKNLKSWLGKRPTIKAKFWLHMVHLRWRISFVRSCRRAKKA